VINTLVSAKEKDVRERNENKQNMIDINRFIVLILECWLDLCY